MLSVVQVDTLFNLLLIELKVFQLHFSIPFN